MQYIADFFNTPKNTYGLQTITTENSLAPIYNYLVLPTELLDYYMYMGLSKITTKKTEDGWVATIISYKDILRTISYLPITFRTFVGRDGDSIKDEAIDWFKKNRLDICDVNNWLLKEN